MHQGLDAGVSPALGHGVEVVVEISKDDVAVAVDEDWLIDGGYGERCGMERAPRRGGDGDGAGPARSGERN